MMQTYARYFCRHLLVPIVVITCILTGLIWITQLLRFTDLMIHRGLSVQHFFSFAMLLIPSFLSLIIPVAAFVGTMFVYHKYNVDCEIIILKQAGINRFSLIKPALFIGILLMLVGYALSLYLSPVAYHHFKNQQSIFRDHSSSLMLEEGVFNNPMSDIMIYIHKRDHFGLMKGVLVYDSRNPEKNITIIAEQGRIIKDADSTYLNLQHGTRQELKKDRDTIQMLHFDHYPLNIKAYNPDSSTRWKEPEERFLHELLFLEGDDANNKKLAVEGHQRLIWPLYSCIAVLIAALGMTSDTPSHRYKRKKEIIVLSTGTFILFITALVLPSLASYHIITIVLMYALAIGSLLLLGYKTSGKQMLPAT